MNAKRALPILLPVLIVAIVLAVVGCAKRPALTQASAPAPTGMPQSVAPPPPATPIQESPAAAPAAPAPAPPPPAVAAAPTPPAPPKDFADVSALQEIHFDFDKANIRPDAARTLEANAAWLRSNGNLLVLVEGHCDERGTNEYNLVLGERRARATVNYLVAHGIAQDRFTLVSYGEERPLCTEHNEACWAKNRRAHFRVKER
ncbi:MAG: peptidoglycan-associated lipoprotein [Candidatus Rokubacteria bacterium 13_1_40CM_68_15]|nr:MAG: peptidoglycan-associated lipoprotein [Candidatus Rokubacteria bacterium 13_1_40CM_68_15]